MTRKESEHNKKQHILINLEDYKLNKKLILIDTLLNKNNEKIIAIGALVSDYTGWISDKFYGRIDSQFISDDDIDLNDKQLNELKKAKSYGSESDLLDVFWDFYTHYFKYCDVWVDYAYPIKTKLFDKLSEIYNDNYEIYQPYVIHEIETVLCMNGYPEKMDRNFISCYNLLEFNLTERCVTSLRSMLIAKGIINRFSCRNVVFLRKCQKVLLRCGKNVNITKKSANKYQIRIASRSTKKII